MAMGGDPEGVLAVLTLIRSRQLRSYAPQAKGGDFRGLNPQKDFLEGD